MVTQTVNDALIAAQCKAMAYANSETVAKSKVIARVTFVTSICMVLMIAFASILFADNGGQIAQKVGNGLQDVYKTMSAIAIPIAVIALGVCGFMFFFGGERGMGIAKKLAVSVLIGLAITYLAPIVITQAAKWFAGNENTTGVWDGTIPTGS